MSRSWEAIEIMAEAMRRGPRWPNSVDIPLPEGLNPCRACGEHCMGASAIDDDWLGRGRVIRIEALCNESLGDKWHPDGYSKDFFRTEFAPEAESVAEWNEMNPQDGGRCL